MKLDTIDLKIVAALRRDGRMTKLKLAQKVA
ncbi:AsnC family transcriptional regulator [Bosea sp. LC85]|nr:AsnC family transcriptional regulator [Bosea sp. LC85]